MVPAVKRTSLRGLGSCPWFASLNLESAWNPMCNCAGRSNLAKSATRNSGLTMASFNGSFASVTEHYFGWTYKVQLLGNFYLLESATQCIIGEGGSISDGEGVRS